MNQTDQNRTARSEALEWETAGARTWAMLGKRAGEIRDEYWGDTVTYSRKVFIPLTNLCRDTCGYCIFAKPPANPEAGYLTPDEVLEIAREGERTGCKEALFSLGERPEIRYPEARAALAQLGYDSTVEYLAAMCRLVLSETTLIPHANPGALREDELRLLYGVTGSMGMMLENASSRFMEKGMPHYQCPDKYPARRIETLEAAGRIGIPFTTGILIGIGETWEERVDALLEIDRVHRKFGTIQEVIVQNFRAKGGIAMADKPDATVDDMIRTITAARLILSPEISLQAPPNLMPEEYKNYIPAGLNDWGGVSPVTKDHINPERVWPKIAELARVTGEMGHVLRERLTIYPRFIENPERFIAQGLRERILELADEDGLPKEQLVA